jgi:hypothetical protein
MKDLTTGITIYTFTGQTENFAGSSTGATCASGYGEDDFTVPTTGLGAINQTDVYEANFTFTNTNTVTTTADPPIICSGTTLGSDPNILLSASPLVTPEFPLGTILSILAPLGAVAAYIAATTKLRRPTSLAYE